MPADTPKSAISLREYARRRGVSADSVSKAVARGRLHGSVVRDERGAPKIADPDLADREWAANTRQRADRQPGAAEPASSARVAAPAPPASEDPVAPAPRPRRADLPDGVPVYHVSQAIRAHHAARTQAAVADQAELDLAARRGALVDAAASNAKFTAHISMAKTRLLTVATLVAQDAPDLALRIVPLIERRIREALEELAIDGRRA